MRDEEETHRFAEGQLVSLVEDRADLKTMAGDPGVVECLYATDPPACEVTFRCRDGSSYGMVCWEDELAPMRPLSPPNAQRPMPNA